eukprot:210080-Chlamydomonas_euryale.AAC.2
MCQCTLVSLVVGSRPLPAPRFLRDALAALGNQLPDWPTLKLSRVSPWPPENTRNYTGAINDYDPHMPAVFFFRFCN